MSLSPAFIELGPHGALQVIMAGASPDQCVLLGTVGLCLIFFELNRPGRIFPGALGLLLLLLSVSAIVQWHLQGWAVTLLLLSFVVLLSNLWRRLPLWLLGLFTGALTLSLRFLVQASAPQPVHMAAALSCGLVLSVLGAFLTRMAFRARRAKAVD